MKMTRRQAVRLNNQIALKRAELESRERQDKENYLNNSFRAWIADIDSRAVVSPPYGAPTHTLLK